MIIRFLSFFLVGFLVVLPVVHAQQPSEPVVSEEEEEGHIIYETPTVKNLSQLYWMLSKLDINNDTHVDNFLMINECDLYRDYYNNEFEWKSIRKAGRKFIEDSRDSFPTYFEFIQPLKLAEYNLETEMFDVYEPYKIFSVRRFEILAEDVYKDVCNVSHRREIEGYPRGLYAELNRPFTLDEVKVHPEVAKLYIEKNNEYLQEEGIATKYKTDIYENRKAYLVMKIRIFSNKNEDVTVAGKDLAKVLGVLEGYEIYGDRERHMLMFAEDFKRKRKRSKMEIQLKQEYQERLKRQMEEKRRIAAEKEAAENADEVVAPEAESEAP